MRIIASPGDGRPRGVDGRDLRIVQDDAHPDGGFVRVVIEGAGAKADAQPRMVVRRFSEGESCLGPNGWQAMNYAFRPRRIIVEKGDIALSFGPEMVDHLEPFTAVRVSLPQIGIQDADVRWPTVQPSMGFDAGALGAVDVDTPVPVEYLDGVPPVQTAKLHIGGSGTTKPGGAGGGNGPTTGGGSGPTGGLIDVAQTGPSTTGPSTAGGTTSTDGTTPRVDQPPIVVPPTIVDPPPKPDRKPGPPAWAIALPIAVLIVAVVVGAWLFRADIARLLSRAPHVSAVPPIVAPSDPGASPSPTPSPRATPPAVGGDDGPEGRYDRAVKALGEGADDSAIPLLSANEKAGHVPSLIALARYYKDRNPVEALRLTREVCVRGSGEKAALFREIEAAVREKARRGSPDAEAAVDGDLPDVKAACER